MRQIMVRRCGALAMLLGLAVTLGGCVYDPYTGGYYPCCTYPYQPYAAPYYYGTPGYSSPGYGSPAQPGYGYGSPAQPGYPPPQPQ